jgi:hypothetical protein
MHSVLKVRVHPPLKDEGSLFEIVADQYQDDRVDTNDTGKTCDDNDQPSRLAPNAVSQLEWHLHLVFFMKTLLWEKNTLLE